MPTTTYAEIAWQLVWDFAYEEGFTTLEAEDIGEWTGNEALAGFYMDLDVENGWFRSDPDFGWVAGSATVTDPAGVAHRFRISTAGPGMVDILPG